MKLNVYKFSLSMIHDGKQLSQKDSFEQIPSF